MLCHSVVSLSALVYIFAFYAQSSYCMLHMCVGFAVQESVNQIEHALLAIVLLASCFIALVNLQEHNLVNQSLSWPCQLSNVASNLSGLLVCSHKSDPEWYWRCREVMFEFKLAQYTTAAILVALDLSSTYCVNAGHRALWIWFCSHFLTNTICY